MSLILEALRKSEAERRRGQAPDVAMELPPLAVRRSTAWPRWWPLLALAAGILLGIWWTQRDATPIAQDPAPAPLPRVDAEPRAPSVVIAPAAPPSIAIPATRPPPTLPTTVDDAPRPAPAPDPAAAPAVAPAPGPEPAAPVVANIGDTAMPFVRMSMHMWNEVPSQRFVILDGQRMVEGDRKGELLLVAIERDGVLVERNGQRARIPLR